MTKFLLNEIKKRDLLLKMQQSEHVKIIKKQKEKYKIRLDDLAKYKISLDAAGVRNEHMIKNLTKFLLLSEKQIDEVMHSEDVEMPTEARINIQHHMSPCCTGCLETALNQFDDATIGQKQKEVEDFFEEIVLRG